MRAFILILVLLVFLLMDYYLCQIIKEQFAYTGRRIFIGVWWAITLFALICVFMQNSLQRTPAIYASNFAMIVFFTKFLIFIPLFLVDAVGWISGRFTESAPAFTDTTGRRKWLSKVGLVLAVVPMGTMLWGLFRTAYHFKTHRISLNFPKLPKRFSGFRIVQISDMHTGSWANIEQMQHLVDEINALEPDLVLFTGDMVNNKTEEVYPFEKYLQQIRAKEGIYAILGNHDYGDYASWPNEESRLKNLDDLQLFYKNLGWKLMRNSHAILQRGEDKIALLGVENWSAAKRFRTEGRLDLAYAGSEEAPVKILMSHDPSHWDAEIRKAYSDIDLTLSGHTHGFQLGIEIPGFKFSPSQWMYKQWGGLYQQDAQYIYVNRGTGCLGYSGRVGIRPEITCIELF